jgi:hypothetical protein
MGRAQRHVDPPGTAGPIVVLHGKKPAMAVWLLVGLLLTPVGLVNLVTWDGMAWVRWAYVLTVLIGAALVFSSAQRMFHLADGNDLVRALNTYGARLG